jgi:glucose-fructose oxidoreductase
MPIKHQVTISEKRTTKSFAKRDQFAAQIVYFSDCVLKGKEPEPSGMEGLADVRIVEAIYESARTRRSVHLPEFQVKRRPSVKQEIHRPANGKPQIVHSKAPSRQAA